MVERCKRFDWSEIPCDLPARHDGPCRQVFGSPLEVRPALAWIPATCKKCGTRNKFEIPFVNRVVCCANCGAAFNLEAAQRGRW